MSHSKVTLILNGLIQQMQSNNGFFDIDLGDGEPIKVTCTFRAPAKEKDIKNFELKHGFTLPKDYREFLLTTNGCKLFHPANDEGETELYSLK